MLCNNQTSMNVSSQMVDATILVSILLAVINVCVIMGTHLEQMNAVVKVKSITLEHVIYMHEKHEICDQMLMNALLQMEDVNTIVPI